MKPVLAVVATEGFTLDNVSDDVGVDGVSVRCVEAGGFPNDAAGLLIIGGCGATEGRDVSELVKDALDMGVPVLGVNAGMHLLNVALGGDGPKEAPTHVGSEDGPVKRMSTFLAPGAKVSSTIGGSGWLGVPCDHEMGISQAGLAPGLMVSALAEDRVVEAFEMPGHRWVIGVQWDAIGANRLPRGFDAIWLAFMERVTGS